MHQQNMFQRYALIITKMHQEKYPSFNNLKAFLADFKFDISPRTLQRIIEHLRADFGIEIKYNKAENGYYIDKKDKFNMEEFLNLLNKAAVSDIFINMLKEQKLPLSQIKFSRQINSYFPVNFENIIIALTNKKVLRIVYQKNKESKEKLSNIHPYQLREYAGYWFLLAWVPEKGGLRVYNIEKLTSIEILKEKFKNLNNLSALDLPDELKDFADEFEKKIKTVLKKIK